MVRYTFALRGPPIDASSPILIREQDVDIFHEEQLSERFLCEINAKGQVHLPFSLLSTLNWTYTLQVPVLSSPSLNKPIADSVDITHYLSHFYPSLIPISHKEQIIKGIRDLHALNYFSLSFPGRDHVAQGFKTGVEKRLSGDISERYREALHFKLGM